MSILTDVDIRDYFEKENPLMIKPFSEECLTPVGYDLRAGGKYVTTDDGRQIELHECMKVTIFPKQTALISTLEKVSMPKDRSISALIVSKVSKVSKGLSHVATTIDADWSGNLIIALTNHSSEKIEICHGESFCTVVFFKNLTPSIKPCEKKDGRPDVFFKDLSKKATEALKKKQYTEKSFFYKSFIAPLIVVFGLMFAYLNFADNGYMITGIVTASVAISQLYHSSLIIKYKK
ncbi:dCTP deaminase domain-containing protein [Desulfosarcina ovata]|uniref:Uncharacterized protein n=1 Tax=Desulfosarcina ovata subsp. ovata TaxID=2752305 RepID=A0A5K8ABN5_9BACT|nr:hypothetical protein [Desulfosarcina ovata]BBO89919.1 hypothetical protein DSCOOX_30990 [Desulfosarcina ovata subsp. ovata]